MESREKSRNRKKETTIKILKDMKIPFDIKFRPQIESGEYKVVIEYDNRTFYPRIVCWDFNSTELLACVNYGDREDVLEYDSSGKHIGKSVGRPDLIIITPEPELSEFEKKLWEIMKSEGSPIGPMDKFTQDDERVFHAYSNQLLDLARKELEPEVLERLEAAYKNQDEVVYENGKREGKAEALKEIEQDPESSYAFKRGFEYGKEEALKDLPRWRKCDTNTIYNTKFNVVINGVGRFLMVEGHQIDIDSLEKLPGFNE